MGNSCFREKKIDYDLIQSVIFYRNKAYNREIIMWDLKRSMAYMAKRDWIWIKPPDESKQNQIRLHVESEDKFETLEYQEINGGICIVFGKLPPPVPRTRRLMINNVFSKKNIHTIHD